MNKRPVYNYASLCEAAGKDALYIRNIQTSLGLKSDSNDKYSDAYLRFIRKIIALRTLSVPQDKISELFEMERKILKLLHIDSLSTSETWYLDAGCEVSATSLLLTGFDIGFSFDSDIQHNLDFSARKEEMFSGPEMGEDVKSILKEYTRRSATIIDKVIKEMPTVKTSMAIAEKLISRRSKSSLYRRESTRPNPANRVSV